MDAVPLVYVEVVHANLFVVEGYVLQTADKRLCMHDGGCWWERQRGGEGSLQGVGHGGSSAEPPPALSRSPRPTQLNTHRRRSGA